MTNEVAIRIGIEGGRRPVLDRAKEIGAPILVSANSLWDASRQRFSGWHCYRRHDVALDSGGFVAMKRYGGYRWTVRQYVILARQLNPTWWAQMDFCCEPEIAADRATVWKRIDATVDHLQCCQAFARTERVENPLPVLQGWRPQDYCEGPIYDPNFNWPQLVGIGSVCRREVNGPNGILAVVAALDKKIPLHVKFHLFGVKSQALTHLLEAFPHRIASLDSMAWNIACRYAAYRRNFRCDGQMRAEYMERWYHTQVQRLRSPGQIRLDRAATCPSMWNSLAKY